MKTVESMSVMQILKSLDNKYRNISIKVKVQIYLLPLLIVCLLLLLFSNETKTKTTKKLINYEKLKMSDNMLDIVNSIESFGKRNKIKLTHINTNKKTISLQAKSTFSSMKSFISFIDELNAFSKIIEINILKNKKQYVYFLTIDFNKFYLKEKLSKKIDIKIKKAKSFRLKAIVSENILINNKWLKQGESINEYKVKEVLLNEVILVKGEEKINLKVFKNDKYIK